MKGDNDEKNDINTIDNYEFTLLLFRRKWSRRRCARLPYEIPMPYSLTPKPDINVGIDNVKIDNEDVSALIKIIRTALADWRENDYKKPDRDTILNTIRDKLKRLDEKLGINDVSKFIDKYFETIVKDNNICLDYAISKFVNRLILTVYKNQNAAPVANTGPTFDDIIYTISTKLADWEMSQYMQPEKVEVCNFIEKKLNELKKVAKEEKPESNIDGSIKQFKDITRCKINNDELCNQLSRFVNTLFGNFVKN